MTPLLRACSGLIVWAIVFSLLYGIEGFGCAQPWDDQTLRIILMSVWLSTLIGLAWLSWRWLPTRKGTEIDRLPGVIAFIGLVSTAWTGFPVAVLSTCI